MSELGANALFPTGGAGGLALGAWALKRGGMPGEEIARRTVAFFLLTSVPNVLGVIVIGLLLATGAVGGESNLLLTALPAAIAAAAVVLALQAGRIARRWGRALERRGEHELSRRKQLLMKGLTALGEGVQGAVALLREGNLVLIGGLIAYLAFDVMIVWATFHALGPAPPLAILWMAYLIGELGGLIPIPGGIGGVDAGLVGTLALYNVSLASADRGGARLPRDRAVGAGRARRHRLRAAAADAARRGAGDRAVRAPAGDRGDRPRARDDRRAVVSRRTLLSFRSGRRT